MSHLERCEQHTIRYADQLIVRIRSGKLNNSAFEGLIRSFLDQPAYCLEQRESLLRLAIDRLA